ncbi:hypothetical protein B0H14DRAFT_3550191 [Mycena olivaceomarginata]|nr:hypothetical protein B0H14DRAFT_3550191 [Mycena olivaceomarginata]
MPHTHSSSCGTNLIFPDAFIWRCLHGVVPATRSSLGTRSHNRPLLNRNSTKYVQHRICALQSTPREACSNTISLAMREMLGVALECPAHPPSVHPVRSSQKSREGELAPATIFGSTAVRTAEWCFFGRSRRLLDGVDAPYDVHRDQQRRSLPGRPSAAPRQRVICSTVPATHTGSTPRRREYKPQPYYQPHAQHATLACLADDTSSPSRTPTIFIASCVRSARFIAFSPAKCISTKYHSPRSTRAQGACTHDPSRAQHLQQPLPIPRATVLVSGAGRTTRSIAGARSKCNEHSPVAHAAFTSSPPRAPRLSSAPTTARNLGLPRTANRTGTISRAQHALQLSPHRPIPSPLPPAGCVCRDDSATGWHDTDHTEAMRTPCFHRYPPSALGISDSADGAPRQFSIAPPACAVRISGLVCPALGRRVLKTWPSLIPSLAQKSKTLTKLYLRERITFHDTPDALDRMLPGDWFHPLLSCANLTEVVILTANGIDIDDAFLKRMATAWPQLRTLDLSPGCQSAAGHVGRAPPLGAALFAP